MSEARQCRYSTGRARCRSARTRGLADAMGVLRAPRMAQSVDALECGSHASDCARSTRCASATSNLRYCRSGVRARLTAWRRTIASVHFTVPRGQSALRNARDPAGRRAERGVVMKTASGALEVSHESGCSCRANDGASPSRPGVLAAWLGMLVLGSDSASAQAIAGHHPALTAGGEGQPLSAQC